jgi:hypothetical protein
VDWKEFYARKVTGNIFPKLLIEPCISTAVNNIIKFNKENGLEYKIEHDKEAKEIIFPTCIIQYKYSEKELQFVKLKRSNREELAKLTFKLTKDGYSFFYDGQTTKLEEGINPTAIETALGCMLISEEE